MTQNDSHMKNATNFGISDGSIDNILSPTSDIQITLNRMSRLYDVLFEDHSLNDTISLKDEAFTFAPDSIRN